jgi:hypothetical protein
LEGKISILPLDKGNKLKDAYQGKGVHVFFLEGGGE